MANGIFTVTKEYIPLHLISTVALSTFKPTIFATAEDMTQNNMTKIINIDDWMISGGGEAGVSYFHKTDPSLILKMDNRETTKAEVEESLETARIVYSLGIPTPEPGEVVFDGRRYGQVFHRIRNKASYARLTAEHPEMIPQLAHEYTEVVKHLHSTKGSGTGLRNIKKTYGSMIMSNTHRPKELLDKAVNLLNSLPDADTCVHGDLHFGNIIKADGRNYLIDIASFSYGHPYFDIAMMVAIHNLQSIRPEYHKELFHCTVEQSEQFWQCFIKEYFGESVTSEMVEQMVQPFLAVRMLTMESESGKPMPDPAIGRAIEFINSLKS